MKPFLRNPCISPHLQIFPWNHFEKYLYFSSFWEIFAFLTTLKKFGIFEKNLCIFQNFSTRAGRPLQQDHFWKIFVFFTTLKNLCIFHHFEIFSFSTRASRPLQQDHLWKISVFFLPFEKSLYFSSLWKISVFFTPLENLCIFTTLKNLCIFHHFKIFVFFT